jgi:hypothetical protein
MNQQNNGIMIVSSEEDIRNYLELYQPGLNLKDSGLIDGTLYFRMRYKKNSYEILDPFQNDDKNTKTQNEIADQYQISIEYNEPDLIYPKVRELGSKIKSSLPIIKSHLPRIITLQDLHLNKDESLCLCTYTEYETKYKDGIPINVLIEDLIIPFFYYQSYLSTYFKEPWKAYSHGYLGLMEYLTDNKSEPSIVDLTLSLMPEESKEKLKLKRPSSKRACICGSGLPGIKCHHNAIIGAKILYQHLQSKIS